MKMDAILPAGGFIDGEFAKAVGVQSKALIDLGGKTVLERTISALKSTGFVDRIVVVGAEPVLQHPVAKLADLVVEAGGSSPDNILKGLEGLSKAGATTNRVLVVTTDLPFLNAELIRRFVEACPDEADICVPLIDEPSFAIRFPGTKATFVTLKNEVWTTGCAYLMDPKAIERAKPHMERVFQNRKSKFGMAKLLGPVFVFKWLTKRLTVADIQRKASSMLGCRVMPIMGMPPELSFDLDYLEDYEYGKEWIATHEDPLAATR